MIRTFIALEIPREIKVYLGEIISGLRQKNRGVKWVQPEGLHITLKFLGNIDEGLVPSLSRELAALAAAFPAAHVSLSRLGAFPDAKRPRVIWAGLIGDTAILADIAAKTDQICTSLGMEPEKRPFRAHITIGRLKLPTVVDLAQEIRERDFTINHVILYKSELTPSGARYSVLHRSVLGQEKGE
ncbi:MAG TPA: RNA 2',3'-cyclic phosphodiesterase [Deltaproteobacteria bacterium]|jgi:2'-5' RNA ligase|nr:RNA 2',3'-cyclic phosphodiesterase [Deltaproteobacteria bacterium]HQH99661.1 RNA 2',3'-cyclic phosphodiesterase [Deltaproteobacteria bacterium]HQJ07411.1 RNA 2',3'-cyclic phosphodiesterase [Deltaproteobacteria bacterium]